VIANSYYLTGIYYYAYDYAPENEADWRDDGPAWPIAEFFKVLKDQFRELQFFPVGPRSVKEVYVIYDSSKDRMIEMLQNIYREHGWPDLQYYRKRGCLEAVYKALEERYPGVPDNS
jgi:hypothetical protein